MSNTGDDCYFYYYSTCTKGKECPFRHCLLALGTETVCTLWREGLCSRANCKFRHMESRINRAHIPCYWENQPGGCRKPHCVFFHKKLRTSSPAVEKSQGLILPVSSQNPTPQVPLTTDILPDSTKNFSSNEQTTENLPLNSPSVSVEPVVVRLIDEESDTESTASTPVKNLSNKISSKEKRLPQMSDAEDRDFGIKTLEQLRMEKIHRESEHFYKSVYDEPLLEIRQMDIPIDPSLDNKRYAVEGHRLGIYLKNLERTQDTPACKRKLNDTISNITGDSSEDDKLPSNDLRDIIRKKKRIEQNRSTPSPEPKKRVISLKKSDTLNDDDSIMITLSEKNILQSQKPKEKSTKEEVEKTVKGSFDFKIKTLAEIRQEKNKKKTISNVDENVVKLPKEEMVLPAPVTTLRSAVQTVKPKVKRPAREIYQVKSSSLSPRKDSSQETVSKRAKLSLSRKKPLSSIQKVNDISNSRELLNEKSKDISEIPNRRTLRLKRKITFENGHEESDKESENKLKNVTAHKKVSLRSIRSFIRPCIAPQLFPAKHIDVESSLTDEHMQQQNNSELPTRGTSIDADTMDSSKIEDEEQPQTNGIDLTETNNEISNHSHQEIDSNSRRRSSSESLTRSISKTSTTDDFDKLLFAEECGLNLDDLRETTVKNDDSIFLEIDKLLES